MKKIIFCIVIFLVVFGISLWYFSSKNNVEATVQDVSGLRIYTVDELKQYDGSNSQKPIYIGMNGNIYDVSEGRKFYEVGGSYHYLVGKDSSKELKLIGGDIIKRKYPVVGVLK